MGSATDAYAGFALDDAHIDLARAAHVHAVDDREACILLTLLIKASGSGETIGRSCPSFGRLLLAVLRRRR
jgi:hypothetical protein